MSKILPSTCQSSSVTCEGKVISNTVILSKGVKSSSGVMFIEQDKTYYSANISDDIKELITSLVSIIAQISLIATGLDGVTTSPGSNSASIAQLDVLKTQLDATKDNLR